jgi:hypothetical protein
MIKLIRFLNVFVITISLSFSSLPAKADFTTAFVAGVSALYLAYTVDKNTDNLTRAIGRSEDEVNDQLKHIASNLIPLRAISKQIENLNHSAEALVNAQGAVVLPEPLSNRMRAIPLNKVYNIYLDILSGKNTTAVGLGLNHKDVLLLMGVVSPETIFSENDDIKAAINKFAELNKEDSISSTDLHKSLIVAIMALKLSEKAFRENRNSTADKQAVNATREASQLYFLPTISGLMQSIFEGSILHQASDELIAKFSERYAKELHEIKEKKKKDSSDVVIDEVEVPYTGFMNELGMAFENVGETVRYVSGLIESVGFKVSSERLDNAFLAIASVLTNMPEDVINYLDEQSTKMFTKAIQDKNLNYLSEVTARTDNKTRSVKRDKEEIEQANNRSIHEGRRLGGAPQFVSSAYGGIFGMMFTMVLDLKYDFDFSEVVAQKLAESPTLAAFAEDHLKLGMVLGGMAVGYISRIAYQKLIAKLEVKSRERELNGLNAQLNGEITDLQEQLRILSFSIGSFNFLLADNLRVSVCTEALEGGKYHWSTQWKTMETTSRVGNTGM